MFRAMAENLDYALTQPESAALRAATEDATGAAGALGAAIGGGTLGGPGAGRLRRRAGASGGRFAVRFTRARTAATTVDVPEAPDRVRERAAEAIARTGVVIEDPNAAGDGSVWGLIPSGLMDMVPALVRVGIDATGSRGSRVHVRATGQEGLIRQRIGAKAVDRIAEAIAGG
jgi:hypothetical protein